MLTRKCLGRFRRDAKGLAALEFALILPVMLTLVFGLMELELALGARTGVAQIADTVGDLVAQESTVTTADLSNVYQAGNTILYPYYPKLGTRPGIRITSLYYDASTGATGGKVRWSCAQPGSALSARTKDSVVTFSNIINGASTNQQLLSSGGSIIYAEVSYNYASPTTRVVAGAITMKGNFFAKPRRVAEIAAPTGGCPTTMP